MSWPEKCANTWSTTKCKTNNWTSMNKITSYTNWTINYAHKSTLSTTCRSSRKIYFFFSTSPKRPKSSSPNDSNANFSLPISQSINFRAEKNSGSSPKEDSKFTLIANRGCVSIARRNWKKSSRSIRKKSLITFLVTPVSFVTSPPICEP